MTNTSSNNHQLQTEKQDSKSAGSISLHFDSVVFLPPTTKCNLR